MTETGVVSEVFHKMAKVVLDSNPEKRILCTYRRAQVIEKDKEWRERSPVSPGDLVLVKVTGSQDGVIEKLLPRKNCLQRRAPGREGKLVHTIVANIDYLVITVSIKEPEFSAGLIDRFLIAAIEASISPILVINKMDLAGGQSTPTQDSPWAIYENLGVKCFPVSSLQNIGLNELQQCLKGKTSAFCGHSGTGKTSLLNVLFGDSAGKTGSVNQSTGKGKHTTTTSKLMVLQDGTRFIDTPGIKEFGLMHINPKNLMEYFPELIQAKDAGESIETHTRFESYLRIKSSLENEGR